MNVINTFRTLKDKIYNGLVLNVSICMHHIKILLPIVYPTILIGKSSYLYGK